MRDAYFITMGGLLLHRCVQQQCGHVKIFCAKTRGACRKLAVSVVERQLLPVHESIVLGSPGFWALASPGATALRAHFYLRVRPPGLPAAGTSLPTCAPVQQGGGGSWAWMPAGCSTCALSLRALQATAAAQEAAQQRPGGREASAPRTADHLITFAEQQATERLPRYTGCSMPASPHTSSACHCIMSQCRERAQPGRECSATCACCKAKQTVRERACSTGAQAWTSRRWC